MRPRSWAWPATFAIVIEQGPWPGCLQPPLRGLDLRRAGSLASRDAETQLHGLKERTCTARRSRQGLHDRRALDAKVRFEDDADQAGEPKPDVPGEYAEACLPGSPARHPGMAAGSGGSGNGSSDPPPAAVRRG